MTFNKDEKITGYLTDKGNTHEKIEVKRKKVFELTPAVLDKLKSPLHYLKAYGLVIIREGFQGAEIPIHELNWKMVTEEKEICVGTNCGLFTTHPDFRKS